VPLRRIAFLVLLGLFVLASGRGQSPNGTISGTVADSSGAVIVGAEILVVNDATRVQYQTKTNAEGMYLVSNLSPGTYRIQVSEVGFKTIIKPEIIIHVQDALAINFTLPIGAASEIVTVTGGAPLVNTQDAAVSTVVDRKYVENMPLNGRSFQDLILLTPGVVTNSPQTQGLIGNNGEFSVNGQRTEANYYSVDGVSANVGASPGVINTPGASGSLPASTALGTTQSLVSVDALEEFRVQSSTYSAEYGRNPGGQFSFVTRSGTNEWHGTAFEYLRNNIFDANDWFNNFFGTPEPPLRQNDFGGTLGGPVELPKLYHGKDKTFFFFSYEGLRLLQPQAASLNQVPTAALRQSAPSSLQPVLNAFPVVNCSGSTPNCIPNLGNGLGEYIGTWSNPSQLDSISVRLDYSLKNNLRLFFRFSDTPSVSASRSTGAFGSPSNVSSNAFTVRTYTFGASTLLSNRLGNELRLNYTSNEATNSVKLDSFGGAQAVDLAQLQGLNSQSYPSSQVFFVLGFDPYFPAVVGSSAVTSQRQWNLVDSLSLSVGSHQLRFGADYRRMAPASRPVNPLMYIEYLSSGAVQANSMDVGEIFSNNAAYPIYTNFSAFGQDEWRLTSRLTISFGLRWEVNPAPSAGTGNLPYTVEGAGNLATMTLAPQGTPLWKTTWFNFAPRLGAAYLFQSTPGWETVVRGGGGVFFDTGQQLGSQGYQGPGFSAFNLFGPGVGGPSASFPFPLSSIPTVANPPVAPYTDTNVYAFPAHLQLPYTLQWNLSVEQALGKSQVLTLSYVGANGRRLLEMNTVDAGLFNPNFAGVIFFRNGLTSSYNSLQTQYQRRLAQGLQALASYTWSHSIDYGSQNSALPYVRGNSDFDVRHSFSAALSYDLPNASHRKLTAALFHHWGLDDRFTARTAFPVNLVGSTFTDPLTGQSVPNELNLIPGVPVYLFGAQCLQAPPLGLGQSCPGGKAINPNAFSQPPQGKAGDAPRNFVRGFGAWQMDVAVRREFPIYERLKLQFRAEAFNVFNHPNFGVINATYCSLVPTSPNFSPGCTFGQATATLAQSLGVLSPLYQMGGPRSMQFALKLIF